MTQYSALISSSNFDANLKNIQYIRMVKNAELKRVIIISNWAAADGLLMSSDDWACEETAQLSVSSLSHKWKDGLSKQTDWQLKTNGASLYTLSLLQAIRHVCKRIVVMRSSMTCYFVKFADLQYLSNKTAGSR